MPLRATSIRFITMSEASRIVLKPVCAHHSRTWRFYLFLIFFHRVFLSPFLYTCVIWKRQRWREEDSTKRWFNGIEDYESPGADSHNLRNGISSSCKPMKITCIREINNVLTVFCGVRPERTEISDFHLEYRVSKNVTNVVKSIFLRI